MHEPRLRLAKARTPRRSRRVWPHAGSAALLLCAQAGLVQTPAAQTTVTEQTPGAQATVTAGTTIAAQGGTVHGKVVAGTAGKPGGVALPGVAVTATNTLTGRKYAAATDVEGAYTMKIPRNGRYVIRVELAGFAPVTTEVVFTAPDGAATAQLPDKTSDFGLQLASRVEAAAAATASATGQTGGASASLLRGLQNLSLTAGNSGAEDASAGTGSAGAALPSLGGAAPTAEAGGDTVAITGQGGQTNALANFSEDELRSRIQQGVEQARASGMLPPGVDANNIVAGVLGGLMGAGGPGGGRGGGGGAGRGGGGGFGGGAFRRLDPTQVHGGLNFQGDYSTFDSAQWSPTLTPQSKPSYSRNTFGVTLAGSPQIPGLIKPSSKQFGFLNFNFSRNTTPEVLTATVPTAAERTGDLSALTQTLNGQVVPTSIYDPSTGQPFVYNGAPNVIRPVASLAAGAVHPEQLLPAAQRAGGGHAGLQLPNRTRPPGRTRRTCPCASSATWVQGGQSAILRWWTGRRRWRP